MFTLLRSFYCVHHHRVVQSRKLAFHEITKLVGCRKFSCSLPTKTVGSNKDSLIKLIQECKSEEQLESLIPEMEQYTSVCCGNGCRDCVWEEYTEITQASEVRRAELRNSSRLYNH